MSSSPLNVFVTAEDSVRAGRLASCVSIMSSSDRSVRVCFLKTAGEFINYSTAVVYFC